MPPLIAPLCPLQKAKNGLQGGMSPVGRILDPTPTLTYCLERSYPEGDAAEGCRPELERVIRSLERVIRSLEWVIRSAEWAVRSSE